MAKERKFILLHVAVVLLVLLLPIMFAPDFMNYRELFRVPFAMRDFFCNIVSILFFYFNYYYLIEAFYLKGKRPQFLLLNGVGIALIFIITFQFLHLHHDMGFKDPVPFKGGHGSMIGHVLFEVSHSVFLFLVGILVALMLKTNNLLRQKEQEIAASELNLIRSQIQPHFLFNTLNSIYSMAITKSPDTADAIVRLSSIMRYAITEAHDRKVPLEKELEYIGAYVELQKLRLGPETQVFYREEGAVKGRMIAPLLILPFVENAFKYGSNPDKPSLIDIYIQVTDVELIVKIVNDKVANLQSEQPTTGLGHRNTRHLLELLYPGRYSLELRDTETTYSVTLKIIC